MPASACQLIKRCQKSEYIRPEQSQNTCFLKNLAILRHLASIIASNISKAKSPFVDQPHSFPDSQKSRKLNLSGARAAGEPSPYCSVGRISPSGPPARQRCSVCLVHSRSFGESRWKLPNFISKMRSSETWEAEEKHKGWKP